MNLFPNEEVVVSSNGGAVVLTNQRIELAQKAWGSYYSIAMFLENISSIEVRFKSNPVLLMLAILSVVIGVYISGKEVSGGMFMLWLFIAIVFAAVWWATRKRIISISSMSGTRMNIDVNALSQDSITTFVDDIQLVQANRMQVVA